MKTFKPIAVTLLSLALSVVPLHLSAQEPPPPPPGQDQAPPPPPPGQDQGPPPDQGPVPDQGPPETAPQQGAPESPQQLQQLVAPIALYPDPLVAQILNASTYPTQIVEAERWLQSNPGLSGQALGQAVDAQPWDPSVKALMQYPSVLQNMDKNLSWTSSLGDAYYNQPQDVMSAIQVMRQRAEQAGNLRTSPQEIVSGPPGQIVVQPASPSVVYVPIYDPWYAYGPPIAVWPGFVYTAWWVPRPFFGFSIGFPIGGFWGGFGWGWHAWAFNWGARAVWFHGAPFVSHSPAFFDRRGFYAGRPGFRGPAPGVRGGPATGFRGGPAVGRPGPAPFHGAPPNAGRGFGAPAGQRGVQSGAFTGFNHGGTTRANAARGRASAGGGGGARGGGARGGGGKRK